RVWRTLSAQIGRHTLAACISAHSHDSGEPVCHLKAGTTRHEQCLPGRHSTSSNVAVISSSRQSTSQTMVPSNSPETMVPSGESMPDAPPPVIVQPVAVPKAKVEPASDTSNEPSAS